MRPGGPTRRTAALSSQPFVEWVAHQRALAEIAEILGMPRDADPAAVVNAVRALVPDEPEGQTWQGDTSAHVPQPMVPRWRGGTSATH